MTMFQSVETAKIGLHSRPDAISQCQADLNAIERDIREMEAPVAAAEARSKA